MGDDALHEFVGFFCDCEIGSEIRIKHFLEAEPTQGGDHFPFGVRTDFITEFLAKCGSHRRSCLSDHDFAFHEGFVEFVNLAMFHKRTRWTYQSALPALNTRDILEGTIFAWPDEGIESPFLKAEDSNALNLFASSDAAAAKNAFRGVAYKAWR